MKNMELIDTPRWIPVTERLPEKEEFVLVVVNGRWRNIKFVNAAQIAMYDEDGWWIEAYPEWKNPMVSHWMLMPEPPGGGMMDKNLDSCSGVPCGYPGALGSLGLAMTLKAAADDSRVIELTRTGVVQLPDSYGAFTVNGESLEECIRSEVEKRCPKKDGTVQFPSCGMDKPYSKQMAIADNADRCVCCGDVIPEGRQVCPKCERGVGG